MKQYDALVVGAGYAGAVAARRLAEDGNKQVLLLERRDHVAGNAYDCPDEDGINSILIHKYGPHIFHTNDKRVYDFLSRFTEWRDYQHTVVASIPNGKGGRMEFPVPFNLDSMEIAFGPEEGKRLGEKLIAAYGAEKKVTILELRQNPDPEIAAIADYVYENVFVHYTMKQWGQRPEDIDPNTTARVPVFLSRDPRYFQDAYQGMPAKGYTRMFLRMLAHHNIVLKTGTDALKHLELADGVIRLDGEVFDGPVIYTGQADELFGFCFGPLPYRTLDFQFSRYWLHSDPLKEFFMKKHGQEPFFQSHGTVNYTVDEDFTRITEFKHLTGQKTDGESTIVKEFSRAYTGAEGEIPYYAIINPENNALYAKYEQLAAQYPNLHLLGRLAEYKYYNMDAIAARALAMTDEML